MFESGRLRHLLTAREISQSELARRVGVTQATIYKLLSGETQGSKHLHKIAHELGTTPAYLMGETDDPDSPTPSPDLTSDERELLDAYRALPPKDRAAVLRITLSMNGIAPAGTTIHDPKRIYHVEAKV